jgi:TolB-like protein
MSARHERVRELYEAALKRPIGERASFVSTHSQGDEDLRLRVVALLTGQQDTELPGAEAAGGTLLAAGTAIGQYRIDGPLGAGGMGVVYRATDTKLNRPAAVKVLPQNLADPEARRRFQREAQMVSSLNHPHIVTVYDAGEYQGRQYLMTEYVDGGTLRQWAARPHGWRAVVELLVGVADAVAIAHEAGILHRDIKPENILLAKNGYAKLADFGLAKLLEVDPLADDAFTGLRPDPHSSLIGTAAYMSPEQAQGLPLDGRSDVYSFGLVLHELLSGQRPDAARALDQRNDRHSAAAAPLGESVPAELRSLVAKALERDPVDRYQTMRELVVDMRRVIRGSGAEARPRRYGWIALAGAAALAVGGYFYGVDSSRGAAIAVLPFSNETGIAEDDYLSKGLGDSLRDRLMELPGIDVQARASSVSFRGQSTAPREIAKSLGVDRLINGSVRKTGDMLEVLVEILDVDGFAIGPALRYRRSQQDFQALQQQIAAEVSALLVPGAQLATVANAGAPTAASERANVLVASGSLLENEVKDELIVDEEKLELAIALYTRAAQADPSSIAAHARLAGALLYGNQTTRAEAPLLRALQLGEALPPGTPSAELSHAYYSYALYLLRTRSRGVDTAYEQAIRLNPNNADALGAYAQWLTTHHRSNEADQYFRRAIDLDKQSVSRYVDYAEMLAVREDMDGVRLLANEIAERFPDARGYFRLARVHELTGDLDVGIAWGLKALQADPKHPEARGQIAELYAKIGDFDRATEFEPETFMYKLFLQRRYRELIVTAELSSLDYPLENRAKSMLSFGLNATEEFASAKRYLEELGLRPTPDFDVDYEGVDYQSISMYVDTLYGLGERDAARRLAQKLADASLKGTQTGHERSWWVNGNLACSEAQLGRDATDRGVAELARAHYSAALAALDRVRVAQGLIPSPFVLDSPCFKPLAKEPAYLALLDTLQQRQQALRQRLPATLMAHGVADLKP